MSTTGTVRRRIQRSSQIDQLSTYSRSSFTQESKSRTSFRPLICQRQVMPGFTLKRRRCEGSSKLSTSYVGNGRGPTRLIWPARTFQSCGNSSILDLRNQRPIGVTRGSLSNLKTGPLIWLNASSSCLRCSASVYIERNLNILNGSPCLPDRICEKSIGPGDVSLMPIAAASMMGEQKIKPSNAPTISTARLLSNAQERSGVDRNTSIGCEPNTSNAGRAIEVRTKSAINQASTPSSSHAAMASSTRPSSVRAAENMTRPTECSCKLRTSSEIGETDISIV